MDEDKSIVDESWAIAARDLSAWAQTPEQLSVLRDAFHMGQVSALCVMSAAGKDLGEDENALVKKLFSFTAELRSWFRIRNPAVRVTRINPFLP